MEVLLGIIITILVLGFVSVCRLLLHILDKMQAVKSAADLARAETIRTLNSIRKRG